MKVQHALIGAKWLKTVQIVFPQIATFSHKKGVTKCNHLVSHLAALHHLGPSDAFLTSGVFPLYINIFPLYLITLYYLKGEAVRHL